MKRILRQHAICAMKCSQLHLVALLQQSRRVCALADTEANLKVTLKWLRDE